MSARPARALPIRDRTRHAQRAAIRGRLLSDVFDVLPAGILIVSEDGRVVTSNPAVKGLLGEAVESATSCCELFGCRRPGTPLTGACITELATAPGARFGELVIDPPGHPGQPVVVAATRFGRGDTGSVLFELHVAADPSTRPATSPEPDTIRIRTLGETVVETNGGELRADWLDQRPGRLLKFLVAHRYTPMHADAIAEALWPRARADTTNTVRHFVHALREKLEPERRRYQRSAFVLARNGGYVLNPERVTVDADEFEREAKAGITAHAANNRPEAVDRLQRALDLYAGDFLIDERFEDWAIPERERLRDLATKPLRILADLTEDGELAAGHLERLAEMEPLDVEIHRELIALWLQQGRRGRALRHYRALQSRLMRELGERVAFDLTELARSPGTTREPTTRW
ncbi:MAG TPA: BTAD domain-containing putative transcriptional regulator [Thermoleophilaceae bacterium]|nr:BTAD domain-containing putative transcriptional regulator [Thermoleophilaceae bacterium]